MPLPTPSLKINTPVEHIPVGRGFYQLEEDELYVPVEYPGKKARFFSYLDSETVSIQLDREGRLIFVQVSLPRRRWKAKSSLVAPESSEPADIRFLDFRDSFKKPSIYCDKKRQNVMIRFLKEPAVKNLRIAANIVAQVSGDNRLVALWIFDIIDDIAGQEIASWRKALHNPEDNPVSA